MMRLIAWCVLLSLAGTPAVAGEEVCGVPRSYFEVEGGFPNLKTGVAQGGPVTVVVLGTASSLGAGTSGPSNAYPERMAARLREDWPNVPIRLVNLSRRGLDLAGMLKIMREEVRQRRPDLMIWQTGTVEAVNRLPIDRFAEQLREGIDLLNSVGTDVLLVDPQYSPRTAGLVDAPSYSNAMFQETQESPTATLFPRLAIMTYLAEEGVMTFGEPDKAAQTRTADRLHACLGEMMAELLSGALGR